MKKILQKFIYLVGLLTFVVGLYIISFVALSRHIIEPFEFKNTFKTHSLRPIYNKVYYPLRWVKANEYSFKKQEIEIYYGWLEEPWVKENKNDAGYRSAQLKQINTGDLVSIGFVGSREVLNSFDLVKYGQYVKLSFGSALQEDSDRFTNALVEIKVVELMKDPRVSNEELTKSEYRLISVNYDKLDGHSKTCAREYVAKHQKKVLEHCLQAGYAMDIAGGCYHVTGYVNKLVFKKATIACFNVE